MTTMDTIDEHTKIALDSIRDAMFRYLEFKTPVSNDIHIEGDRIIVITYPRGGVSKLTLKEHMRKYLIHCRFDKVMYCEDIQIIRLEFIVSKPLKLKK